MYLWVMLVLIGDLQSIQTATMTNFGAEYLQSAIRDLHKKAPSPVTIVQKPIKKGWPDLKPVMRVTNVPPDSTKRVDRVTTETGNGIGNKQDIPELSLTKGELMSLYESAIANGNSVKLNSPYGGQVQVPSVDLSDTTGAATAPQDDNPTGYYYYYYPLTSFSDDHGAASSITPDKHAGNINTPPQQTIHSHTHQHNVKIESHPDPNHKNKGLEPLFMAISSFVGMAVMFVFSMVFLPKLTGIKSRRVEATKTSQEQQMISLTTIVFKAIEGHDCSERISCEIGKTMRTLRLHDNRFTKLFQRLVPASFSNRIDQIKKHALLKQKCNRIQCKKRKPAAKVKTNKNNRIN